MNRSPDADYRLVRYDRNHAAAVASWAPLPIDLLWLAPGTPPPLTAEKVAAWGCGDAQRYFLWDDSTAEPVGYGELDYLAPVGDQMWIGHFIIAPRLRGHGLGRAFAGGLLRMAFDRFAASEVVLLVFPDNAAAVRCYASVGFQPRGAEAKYFDHIRAEYSLLRMTLDRPRFRRVQAVDPFPELPLPAAPT